MITILLFMTVLSCPSLCGQNNTVITTDIDNFWKTYDLVIRETDSLKQVALVDSLYIRQGSFGLHKIIEVRNYTAADYVMLINNYPKYWNSIRENSYKSKNLAAELATGIQKLKAIYPDLTPAIIYFTFGAMRSNGTTRDGAVLIGSELAMADSSTDISEFEGQTREWLATFFATDPIESLVLLNVHEYVHTQQHPIPNNLLHTVLYEGIAEFVSVKAMGRPSTVPAIAYGKSNPAVRETFEREMFYEWTFDWLWSNSPNDFGVRDLGYYIGYAIAESHYESAADKLKAIKELITLDYGQPETVDSLIDRTGFFSQPIAVLRQKDSAQRPKVTGIKQFENGSPNVPGDTTEITITFSEPMNGHNTGVDYGPLGESAFPETTNRSWAPDVRSWTMYVNLQPKTKYQIWITNNFRTSANIPILPFLIEFSTL